MPHITGFPECVVAFDSFRGTATSRAAGRVFAERLSLSSRVFALSDGGEGFRRALTPYSSLVTAPDALGGIHRVRVGWIGKDAFIEAAEVCGLAMIGGSKNNYPLRATSTGLGVVIAESLAQGAHSITIGCGGSATTDGGLGMVSSLLNSGHLPLSVPCTAVADVRTLFLDSPRLFGPQKGATFSDVVMLTRRLDAIAYFYADKFHRDPRVITGTGSAGGIAGGLYALGADVAIGLDFVSKRVGLHDALEHARYLVTGEGRLDDTSFEGKAVGELMARAQRLGISCTVVVGSTSSSAHHRATQLGTRVFSLEEHFGAKGFEDVYGCLAASADWLFEKEPQ